MIARVEDINCSNINEPNNTLYLFYNYQPWRENSDICDVNRTILSRDVKGFEVGIVNDNLYFNLTIEREIRGIDQNITISKQKVVF